MTGLMPHSDWFLPRPVVYVLFHGGMPQWVGQTINLPQRLQEHSKPWGVPWDQVWITDCHERDQDQLELTLMKYVRPALNKQGNGLAFRSAGRETRRHVNAS